jgi:hypothetical protein
MDSDSILTAGAIAGIVIGSLIIEVLICYYLWKNFETVKKIIWKRRYTFFSTSGMADSNI